MNNPDKEEEAKPLQEPSDSKPTGLFAKLFQSQDSTSEMLKQHVFKSNDSTDLSNMMKSDVFKSSDPFKSNDSFLAKLMGSSDSKKSDTSPSAFASLFRSTSDAMKSAASVVSNKIPDVFTSRDWARKYASKHVDVDVSHVFESENSGKASSVPELVDKKQPPPQKGKTDWDSLYEAQLAATVPPPAVKSPPPQAFQLPCVAVKPVAAVESKTKSNKRKRQKSNEDQVIFVEPNDNDVLLGRGGRTNNHPGNQQYLLDKDAMQKRYLAATKQAKTGISQELVEVVHARGARFLKFDETVQQWYEVPNIVARKKCSQTLREINTPEQRAAKRARYKKVI